ncbi:unnamed protein product [[Candida] boidinii]|nr:unnamed protein product [[Candida] boidinii]
MRWEWWCNWRLGYWTRHDGSNLGGGAGGGAPPRDGGGGGTAPLPYLEGGAPYCGAIFVLGGRAVGGEAPNGDDAILVLGGNDVGGVAMLALEGGGGGPPAANPGANEGCPGGG